MRQLSSGVPNGTRTCGSQNKTFSTAWRPRVSKRRVFLWRLVPKEASLTFAPSFLGTRLGQGTSSDFVNFDVLEHLWFIAVGLSMSCFLRSCCPLRALEDGKRRTCGKFCSRFRRQWDVRFSKMHLKEPLDPQQMQSKATEGQGMLYV
jgi:hypothetical protein